MRPTLLATREGAMGAKGDLRNRKRTPGFLNRGLPVPRAATARIVAAVAGIWLVGFSEGWAAAAEVRRAEFVASDGVRLSYQEAGPEAASPMVLVPGWMCPGWIWERQIEHFAVRHRVVVLDPRAQGESQKDAADLTPERRARDIRELIENCGLKEVTLVGWSMAVGEALSYVEQYGTGNLRGLVLVDGFLGGEPTKESLMGRIGWMNRLLSDRPAFLEGFLGMFFRQPQPAEWLARLRRDIERTPAPAAFTLMMTAAGKNHLPVLERIDRPVLYLHQPMLAGEGARLRERLSMAQVVSVNDAGHALFVDQPELFNRAVDTFLARASAPAAAPSGDARAALYDELADGADLIASALSRARPVNHRVLLVFGANWCSWCHKLHRLFRDDAAVGRRLASSYEVVWIDVNEGHNAGLSGQYGRDEQAGVPYLMVLDADGKVLTRQETGALEEGNHHDPAKVLAFLDRWAR